MNNLPELLSALGALITLGITQWVKSEKDKGSVEHKVAVEANFLESQIDSVDRAQLNTNTSVGDNRPAIGRPTTCAAGDVITLKLFGSGNNSSSKLTTNAGITNCSLSGYRL